MASRRLVVEVVGDSKSLQTAFGKGAASARLFGGATEDAAAKHQRGVGVINTASKVAVGAVAGIAAGAIKMAGDYQSSMNTLQAVSGSSGAEMKKLSALAIKLGNDTKLPGASAQDAAEAMTEMTKAGVSLKDTMKGVRGVLVLSAAAGVSNARAAEIASNALNTFKLKGEDVNVVVDELANTANASSVEIEDVADATKMAGAVFSAFQGPVRGAKGAMTDLNVAIGLLGNAGIKGSDAGTSLKQTLLQLTGPSAKSKDAMKALYIAAKDYGASEVDVAAAIRGSAKERGKALNNLIKHNKALGGSADIAYDATGKMRSLKDIIALTSAATKHMTQEQKNAALTQIFGADATRSVITLMKAGPKEWDKMTEAVTKQGSAQRLADAKMKGFKGSLEAAKSAVETLAITFGTMLLPAATAVVRQLTSLTNALGEHKTTTVATLAVVGSLGAAIWSVNLAMRAYKATMAAVAVVQGTFALATGGMVTALNAAKVSTAGTVIGLAALKVAEIASTAATIGLTAATTALDVAMGILLSPIVLVIAAIALLAAGVIYAYKHSETFRKIVNAMWATLKTVAAWMVTAGAAAFTAVGNAAKVAWTTVDTVTRTVWGGLKAFLGGIWTGLQTTATTVWDGIKTVILTPIRAVRDALGGKDGIWTKIESSAAAAWDRIKTGVGDFATGVKDAVVSAFEGAANKVIDFVNEIIKVVNLIPGVPTIKKIGHIGGSGGGKSSGGGGGPHGTGKLAKGGMVPGSGYGDKVPLHLNGRLAAMVEPGELVSVANRNATAALMRVNSAVPRFAAGGVFNSTSYGPPWTGINGTGTTATGVNLKGSPHTYGVAVDPSVIGLGSNLEIWPNPFNTRSKFKAFDTGSAIKGRRLDFYDWRGRSAQYGWGSRPVRVGGGAVGPGIGDILGNLNPADLISKLPGVGGLPDWLKGTGKWVLDKAGDYIKNNVAKFAASNVDTGGIKATTGPNGIGTYQGLPMANWVIGALKYGLKHGAFGKPTSGYRSHAQNVAAGRNYFSEHEGTQYPHGAVDFGGFHSGLAEKLSYVRATAGYKYPLLAPKGFVDDGHASGTGHQRGGVLPYVGKYHQGGTSPAEGLAHVAKGERIGGPAVHIENVIVDSKVGVNSLAERIAFRVATA